MYIIDLPVNYLIINKFYVKKLGINAAFLYEQLYAIYKNLEIDGKIKNIIPEEWFHISSETLENELGLSKYQQAESLKKLVELNMIEYKISGLPAKRYFKIKELK